MTTAANTPPTTTMNHHSFSVKLTSKNYLAWKTQFLPLLNYQNLTGYVDGSLPRPLLEITNLDKPKETIPNPAYLVWLQKDQVLLCWLLCSPSEEIFPYVTGLTSSAEEWSALPNTFGAVSHNGQLQLNIELHELEKGDLSGSTYL